MQKEWVDPTAAEIKILRRAANNDKEFAALLIARFKEKNNNGIALTATMHPVSLGPPSECKVSKESLEEVVLEKWVGLTDEEIEGAIDEGFAFGLDDGNVSNKYVIRYARAIEAMLKEKNSD